MPNLKADYNGLTPEQAAREYHAGDSTLVIARRWSTPGKQVSPKQVSRLLERAGCVRRTPEQARENSVLRGRAAGGAKKGAKHSEAHRAAIGRSQAKRWAGMTAEQRAEVSAKSRQTLAAGGERAERFRSGGAARLQGASHRGSKIAVAVCDAVRKLGLPVEAGLSVKTPGRTVRPACVVSEEGRRQVAVLVFGPSHFRNVFGAEKLATQRASDVEAVEALVEARYSVLVVEVDRKSVSETCLRELRSLVQAKLPRAKAKKTVTIRV